jgi:transcriptional regulator with XRE-family HTH domain
MSDVQRLKALRERTGKSADETAALAGLQYMEYFDLEFHDDELRTVPSLAQIKRLAEALQVSAAALFHDNPDATLRRVPYAELVSLVSAQLAAGTSKEAFEEDIGWELDVFFESEEHALAQYGIEFLEALCSRLGIDWMAALP